jgi:hypothetical protein
MWRGYFMGPTKPLNRFVQRKKKFAIFQLNKVIDFGNKEQFLHTEMLFVENNVNQPIVVRITLFKWFSLFKLGEHSTFRQFTSLEDFGI